jgi:hypothetical protein
MKTLYGIAMAVALALAPSASATINNPDFETGVMLPWTGVGDFSLETDTAFGASTKLVLTTAPGSQTELAGGALDVTTLLGLVGLTQAELDGVEPADGQFGSALVQDFDYSTAATATISFDYQLFSDETNWNPPFADFVVVHVFEVGGGGFQQFEVVTDVLTQFNAGNFNPSATTYQDETGVNTYTLSVDLPNPGDYTIEVLVFDVVDNDFDTAVALDNFSLVVPEPRLGALLGAGLFGLLWMGRVRR